MATIASVAADLAGSVTRLMILLPITWHSPFKIVPTPAGRIGRKVKSPDSPSLAPFWVDPVRQSRSRTMPRSYQIGQADVKRTVRKSERVFTLCQGLDPDRLGRLVCRSLEVCPLLGGQPDRPRRLAVRLAVSKVS